MKRLLALASLTLTLTASAATTVKFDQSQKLSLGDEITIRGKVFVGEFFGAPGYGSDPKKDKVERFFILQLPSQIRVESGSSDKGPDLGVSFMQLIVRDLDKLPFKDYVGRKIELTGKITAATGPRNHTSLLIDVSVAKPIERWDQATSEN